LTLCTDISKGVVALPLYTLTTQAGVLSAEAKATLADQLTTLHTQFSGVPKDWVHVVFRTTRLATASPPEGPPRRRL